MTDDKADELLRNNDWSKWSDARELLQLAAQVGALEERKKYIDIVLRITVAYEQGVGHARRTELSNPYGENTLEYEAWDMGREFGLRKPEKITLTFESERDYLDVKETIEILKNSESERGYSGYYVTLNEDDCIRICRAWSRATKPTLDN